MVPITMAQIRGLTKEQQENIEITLHHYYTDEIFERILTCDGVDAHMYDPKTETATHKISQEEICIVHHGNLFGYNLAFNLKELYQGYREQKERATSPNVQFLARGKIKKDMKYSVFVWVEFVSPKIEGISQQYFYIDKENKLSTVLVRFQNKQEVFTPPNIPPPLKTLLEHLSLFKTYKTYCANCVLPVPQNVNNCCKRCKVTRYCDRECAVQDWRKGHKRSCKGVSGRDGELDREFMIEGNAVPSNAYSQYREQIKELLISQGIPAVPTRVNIPKLEPEEEILLGVRGNAAPSNIYTPRLSSEEAKRINATLDDDEERVINESLLALQLPSEQEGQVRVLLSRQGDRIAARIARQ